MLYFQYAINKFKQDEKVLQLFYDEEMINKIFLKVHLFILIHKYHQEKVLKIKHFDKNKNNLLIVFSSNEQKIKIRNTLLILKCQIQNFQNTFN